MPNIRLANKDDIAQLVALEKNAFDPSQYHLTSRRQFHHLVTKANAQIWVFEIDSTIAGAAVLLYRRGSGYIRFYSLCVDPQFQGHNVGKELFVFCENLVSEKAMAGMLLEVRADNTKLLQRYENIGYSRVRSVADYYPDHMACIKMKKVFKP